MCKNGLSILECQYTTSVFDHIFDFLLYFSQISIVALVLLLYNSNSYCCFYSYYQNYMKYILLLLLLSQHSFFCSVTIDNCGTNAVKPIECMLYSMILANFKQRLLSSLNTRVTSYKLQVISNCHLKNQNYLKFLNVDYT